MAVRPVFKTKTSSPYFEQEDVTFTYCTGFSAAQRKHSSENMKNEYMKKHSDANLLEVSRFSDGVLGQSLSAFNLLIPMSDGASVPVENAFQSGKVFAGGIQYTDLLRATPMEAKKDERIHNSGNIICFRFDGMEFPIEPKTFFYDWIYINALYRQKSTVKELLTYDSFTDIVFNPEKSVNCQARTVAVFVSLYEAGKLDEALKSPDAFKLLVYEAEMLNSHTFTLEKLTSHL